MNALNFQSATLNPVQQNDNQVWISASDLANALGYARVDSVSRIYDRNKDEFSKQMSQTVNLTVCGKINDLQHKTIRIFSLRGCHLIAMFARTPVAKEFRKWVLDVIEKKESRPKKKIDLSQFVTKDLHNRMALKYHRMFRQYDDLVDRLRDQVDEMQRKCRRYDMKLHNDSIPLDLAAIRLGVTQSKIKQLLIDERMIEERTPYIETDKKVLNLTKRGLKLEFIFIRSEIIEGEVQDIIMITDDGIQYLIGMLNK
ncbi:Bro-N domain-containing protein [Acinetobacter seifertii]|uniref:BRO-N domain-containing protein n=1 Tax=Acinetobacter seifertii TaxID=1530123 RepID=UPI00280CB1E7|nr:Bro-N domain-containing protein [Acinetobacter seifertii]MDQ9037634.1 Bro-N domain-containing protein [Acinetobacter seifertii]